jgi:hypothetical protein
MALSCSYLSMEEEAVARMERRGGEEMGDSGGGLRSGGDEGEGGLGWGWW